MQPAPYNPNDPEYIKNAKLEPTIAIRKASGRVVLIPADQFDEKLHERVEATSAPTPPATGGRVRSAEPEPEPEKEPKMAVSAHNENELARMSVADLKELPEFARVTKSWRSKQDLVMAILSARLMTGEGDE